MISETSALGSCVGTQSIEVNICGSDTLTFIGIPKTEARNRCFKNAFERSYSRSEDTR
jgi:hypothetical protein